MNSSVKLGLIGAVSLIAFFGLLGFTLRAAAFTPQSPATLMRVSIVTGILLIGFISYCLWRTYRSGVIILIGRSGYTTFHRSIEPVQYWFWFSCYLLLIPLILWLIKHRFDELHHRFT